MIEQWAREAIIKHNECMAAAYTLVLQAETHCENNLSNQILALLEKYEVDPDTGDFVNESNDEAGK